MLSFIDDILIYSKKLEEHKRNFQIVLQILREHQIHVKYSKCEIYRNKVQYMGHVITQEGITIVPEKIKAIMEWHVTTNVVDIRSFVGLFRYYQRLIE